jgi:hypothetical protein
MPRRSKFQFSAANDNAPKSVLTDIILVWVQCKQNRCLAYQNAEGQWINFYTGKILTEFVEVIG